MSREIDLPLSGRSSWMVAGLAALAIPLSQSGARLAVLLAFNRIADSNLALLGGWGSHTDWLYNFPGFYLPALLLVVFALGLHRVFGRGRLAAGICGIVLLLSLSTLLLGFLPYLPDRPLWTGLREAARWLYFWCLPVAAMGLGLAAYRCAQVGQSLFSLGAGLVMAIVTWLGIGLNLTELTLLAINTLWYMGTGAWLLLRSQTGIERLPVRLLRAALIILRSLSAVAVLASIYPLERVLSVYFPIVQAQAAGRTQVYTFPQDPFIRTYRVYRPVRLAKDPGLVILLHGSGGTGLQAELDTRFDRQADRLGWIVAYPDGESNLWNAYGCCSGSGVDDVGFLSGIILQLETTYGVSPGRIYITGFSLGGMMAYRAACELSSQVVAIAPVAGNMAAADGSVEAVPCRPGQVVSVLAVHGTDDSNVPILGGRRGSSAYAPLEAVIDRWRQLDGCRSSSTSTVAGPLTTTTWTCRDGSLVQTCVIAGGGHVWPGSAMVLVPTHPDAAFDASRAIADFFASQTRPSTP